MFVLTLLATDQTALTQPYAIFARTEAYWQSARYPKELSYGIVVSVWERGNQSVAHYHSSYDARTDKVRIAAVSDEELAHPYTPHGINFSIKILNGGIPASAPQRTFDYLGVPVLAPNYSFTLRATPPLTVEMDGADLVREIRREFHDPAPPGHVQPDTGLKTIAVVTSISSHYVVRLKDVESVDAHNDYHLTLQPIHEPEKYRLRDVWVNASSFATDKLVTQGNFLYGGMGGVPWTVSFEEISGAPYIASEYTESAFSLDQYHYDAARITFEDVKPEAAPPFSNLRTFDVNALTGVPPLLEP